MGKNRSDTSKQRSPAFSGRVIFDTWRGVVRVRSWPKKRGKKSTPAQRIQRNWFRAANQIALRADPTQIKAAMEATRNSGLYPRDLIIRAMGVGLIDILQPDGSLISYRQHFWEPIMFQGTILRLATPFSPATGTWNVLPWPVPLIDTAGMWNPGQPTRLTIPANIEVVMFVAGNKQDTGFGPLLATRIRQNGVLDVAWGQATSSGSVGHGISTGPLPVVEGDFFDVLTFPTLAGNLAVGPTYFASIIMQAA